MGKGGLEMELINKIMMMGVVAWQFLDLRKKDKKTSKSTYELCPLRYLRMTLQDGKENLVNSQEDVPILPLVKRHSQKNIEHQGDVMWVGENPFSLP